MLIVNFSPTHPRGKPSSDLLHFLPQLPCPLGGRPGLVGGVLNFVDARGHGTGFLGCGVAGLAHFDDGSGDHEPGLTDFPGQKRKGAGHDQKAASEKQTSLVGCHSAA